MTFITSACCLASFQKPDCSDLSGYCNSPGNPQMEIFLLHIPMIILFFIIPIIKVLLFMPVKLKAEWQLKNGDANCCALQSEKVAPSMKSACAAAI